MATRNSRIAIGALVLVTILLIVLLILVSITFSKVNSPVATVTNGPPATTTAVGMRDVEYHGSMNTGQEWDDRLMNSSDSFYIDTANKYNELLTASLTQQYPTANASVSSFEESNPVPQLERKKRSPDVDNTVIVKFTSTLKVPSDQIPPPSDAIKTTINTNINQTLCDDCNVTDVAVIEHTTTTTSTTTRAHEVTSSRMTIQAYQIAADYLISNMDESVEPCEDFYKFACGNFKKSHPPPKDVVGFGTFDLVQDRVSDQIEARLKHVDLSSPTLEDWLRKTTQFYNSCMDHQQKGLEDNSELLAIIKSFGGWPMIMKNGTWDSTSFKLDEVLARLTTNFSVNTLISTGVDLDWKKPIRYILQVDQATLGMGNRAYYLDKKFEDEREDYKEMIRRTASILLYDQDMPQDDLRVARGADAILELEKVLAMNVKTEDHRQNYSRMYNTMSVSTLQQEHPFMNWEKYFDRLLSEKLQPFGGDVNVVEVDYLDKLNDVLDKVDPETIANYLIWRLVYSLDMFMDDRLKSSMVRFQTSKMSLSYSTSAPNDCVSLIINNLGFAAARLLLEGERDIADKNNKGVVEMTNTLKEAFSKQLDTLFWMDDVTRKMSKEKLDDYEEIAGYPKFINDKNQMNKYYKDFKSFRSPERFLDDYISLMSFYQESQFRVINMKNVTRKMWTMSPAIVNAWYLPEFNSITFPEGILRPPFFRYDFPPEVNYGSLGAVIGHEITHGFDDQGVQFNGTGYLSSWMSPHSRLGFQRMVDCVIDQYNRTCFSEVDMCIDGVQTQGENTADNGGIREAFLAFSKYKKDNPDLKQLPGLENYTSDQLFFISFANVWCGDFETPEYLEQQLVSNVHSPPPARVMNTLKNFADFGRAFQCEVGQPYYPFRSEACYVWESPKVSTSAAYNSSAQYLLSNMNQTVDPCDNFYEYACGKFVENYNIPKGTARFIAADVLQDQVYDKISESLRVTTKSAPVAIQEAQKYFEVCVKADTNATKNNSEILHVLTDLGGWPAIEPDWKPKGDLTKDISALVGGLSSDFGLHTFLVPSVQVDPDNPERHLLTLDQSSLALAKQYYTEPKLSTILANYTNLIFRVIQLLANDSNTTISPQDANEAASNIVNFEKGLADRTYDDRKRRNFTVLYNLYPVSDLPTNFSFISWTVYLDRLVHNSDKVIDYFKDTENASVIISEPDFVPDLGKYITEQLNRDDSIVQNYLLWRLIYDRKAFLGREFDEAFKKFKLVLDGVADDVDAERSCIGQLANMLDYTVGRVYVDFWRTLDWRKDVEDTINNITSVFNEALTTLDWMDVPSKMSAKKKVQVLTTNAGFPDWILNNTELDRYYRNYSVDVDVSFFETFNNLNRFAFAKDLESIVEPVDKKDFQMSPATVNAWYNPSLNSLTVPAAILNEPFYDPEYPTAIKYGAIGVIMGHELTHAFDDSGIQFNGTGNLDLWMTDYSRDSYEKNVVDCIVHQYDQYCHEIDGEQFCNSGYRTQGENIADNGGIRQAFRAYRNYIKEKVKYEDHEEELMPGLEWHNEDQLFFISFAQFWCGYMSERDLRKQLLTNVHSPPEDRVRGSVSNFEEFDKAFHCKVGQPMDPVEKCYVWTDPIDTTPGYNDAAFAILESLDPSTDPCEDFYQYACGGWIAKHPVPEDGNSVSTSSKGEENIIDVTSKALNNTGEGAPKALKQARDLFEFCVSDQRDKNSTSLDSFQQYVDRELFGWPMLTKNWQTIEGNDQIFEVAGKLGALGVSTILNAYTAPNYGEKREKNDTNMTYALAIDQASLLLGNREIYLNKTFDKYISAYRDVMLYVAVELSRQKEKMTKYQVPIQSIHSDVEDVINFEKALAKMTVPDTLQQNYTLLYHSFTLKELKKEFPNFSWDDYLKSLLPEHKYNEAATDDFPFIVSAPGYLKAFENYIQYASIRTVQNYLVWRYTINVVPSLGTKLRNIVSDFKRKTGMKQDFADVPGCTSDIITYLPYVAGRLYVQDTWGEKRELIKNQTKREITEIVDHFHERLLRLDWLDPKTKAAAEDKLNHLIENVAYPDWIFDDQELNDAYATLTFTEKDYFTSKQEVASWFMDRMFRVLWNESVDRENFQESPAILNAWYNPNLNSLTVPIGIMQPPFFRHDFPSAINFGGLGAVAGHELTHGFDNDGVQFGPYGHLLDWIDTPSMEGFENITECVINQYNQYCYDDLPTGRLCVNGKVTQGENIADDGGTKSSYNAYKKWVRENGYEALLPGLEKFNMDQIFFLGYAQVWCENKTPEQLERQLLLDVHSPGRDRVTGTLSDMQEFQDAFRCKAGDKMVPAQRCNVW